MYLDNVWRPNLSITGASGIPHFTKAGNVVRSSTTVRISLRLSPDFDSEVAKNKLIEILTTDVPYNAKVTILKASTGNGFCMKVLHPWL
jgi:hypothetical protein